MMVLFSCDLNNDGADLVEAHLGTSSDERYPRLALLVTYIKRTGKKYIGSSILINERNISLSVFSSI